MNISILSKKKLLIPTGIIIFILAFLSNVPLETFVNKEVKKLIPRKCLNELPDLKVSLFPLPSVRTYNKFNLTSLCSGMGTNLKVNEVTFSSRGFSFNPIGLKFNSEIEIDRFKPLELSISAGTSSIKIIMDNTVIPGVLIKDTANLPIDIEGDLEVNLITSFSKKGITQLDANIKSKNLNLPSQMVSGFNIPNIKASPFQIDTKITKAGVLEVIAVKIGDKKSDLFLMGKGEIKQFNDKRKSSLNLMATLALKKELKTQFSFIDLLLGNSNEMGEYKFQVSGKLNSPRVKSLN